MKRITTLGLAQMEATVMIVRSNHGQVKVALAEVESEIGNEAIP